MSAKSRYFSRIIAFTAFLQFSMYVWSQTNPVCSLITDNYSGQITSGRCAPVTLTMEVVYKFMAPVDPSKVSILYRWNDGTGAEDIVTPTSQGDTVFRAVMAHVYPPAGNCSYTAEAFVICDGTICLSSSRQEQQFSSWARDNENGGVLQTDPEEALFCEGEDVYVRFRDNSNFNCNINDEPDKPNRLTRWVQFIYGTNTNSGHRIPNITVTDGAGVVHLMTDASGNSLGTFAGPIIPVPINADAPNQTAYPIAAPAGGVAGDIFEITMRNWNVCNAYDNKPFDGIPPSNLLDGDNPPITTTALVRIITTPPVIINPKENYCVNSLIQISVPQAGDEIRWYSDSLRTNLIHTGADFNPTAAPVNLNNSIAGKYRYWVTDAIGQCESAPSKIDLEVFAMPSPWPNAGPDQVVCGNQTTLDGSIQTIGTGTWTTSGSATIVSINNPKSLTTGLLFGSNQFTWTVTNGPCVASDQVNIVSDRQPAPANAGHDSLFCDPGTFTLKALPPTQNGIGQWSVLNGGSVLANPNNAHSSISNLSPGMNQLLWSIQSRFGACNPSSDTVTYLSDISPDPANAGPDQQVCQISNLNLSGNAVTNGGAGTWSLLSGTGSISGIHTPNTSVSGLSAGTNAFIWQINSALGICPSSRDTLKIIRDLAPNPAIAGPDQTFCGISVSNPLSANLPNIGTAKWQIIQNPSGNAPVFTPSDNSPNAVLSVNPGNEGRYELAWEIVNGACKTSDTIVVDFGVPPSPADAGPDVDTCGLEIFMNAKPPVKGFGTWKKISGPGNLSFVSGVHDPHALVRINSGDEGIYLLEWFVASGTCVTGVSNHDTAQITFRPKPLPPVVKDTANCGVKAFNLLAPLNTNATSNRWYDALVMGNQLQDGTAYSTPVLYSTTSYYISGFNSVSMCESDRVKMTVNIKPVPGIPAAASQANCGPASFNLTSLAGSGSTENKWYKDSLGVNYLQSGLNYSTSVLSTTTSYYVSAFNSVTGCESPKKEIKGVIHVIPSNPTASDVSHCGSGSVTLNAVKGSNATSVRWYDSPAFGTLLETSDQLFTPSLDTTRSYWVSSYNDSTNCESDRVEVKAIIKEIPGLPVTADVSSCGADTLNFHSTLGTHATSNIWYDNITGNNVLAITTDFSPFVNTSQTFWVSSYNSTTGCESPRIKAEGYIKPIPNTSPIQGPSVVAQNQVNIVYSVLPHSGSTFHWSIPADVDQLLEKDNIEILGFPNLGTKTITVFEIGANGCQGPLRSKDVLVKKDVISIKVDIEDSAMCINGPIQLQANVVGGTPPYVIKWTGDTSHLSQTTLLNPVFSATTPGEYHLKVSIEDLSTNSSSDSVVITIHDLPKATIPHPDTTICGNEPLLLTPENTGGSGYYVYHTWMGNTNNLTRTDVQNPVFTSPVKGTYRFRYKVMDSNNCVATDSVTIHVNTPEAKFTTDAIPACSPVKFNFENQSTGSVNYHWKFGDGDTTNAVNTSHLFENKGNGVAFYGVELTATDQFGCSHSVNKFVQIYPNPDITIQVNPEKACHPANVLLEATPGNFTYDWNYGDGTQEKGSYNAYHVFKNNSLNDTIYQIQMVSTSFFGCKDTANASVMIYPTPAAKFMATPTVQMFPDATVSFVNQTNTGNFTYEWNFGDGITASLKDPDPKIYANYGNYTIRLVVKNMHCSDSTEQKISITPHPPIADFDPIDPACAPNTVHFQNKSQYADSYLWEFGDGSVSNKPNPTYTYYESGEYTVKLTTTGAGGTSSKTQLIKIYIVPKAFFDMYPKVTFVNSDSVHYTNLSENGDLFTWEFGDGITSGLVNPVHTYANEGSYNVSLTVTTKNGCADKYTKDNAVVVEASGKIVYPNVFSPFSQLVDNKIFLPGIIDNVSEYHLMIYSRWGELVFESKNVDIGWDGYYLGKPAKQDVYMWKVVGKYSNGRNFTKTGDVTLLY